MKMGLRTWLKGVLALPDADHKGAAAQSEAELEREAAQREADRRERERQEELETVRIRLQRLQDEVSVMARERY